MPDFAPAATPPAAPATPQAPAPTPVSVGVGATVLGGSNMLTASTAGLDANGLAAGVTLAFNWMKKWDHFNQHAHAEIVLLLLGLGSAVGVALLANHGDLAQAANAIPKGCQVGWQAMANYVGQKAAGIGGLAPAANPA